MPKFLKNLFLYAIITLGGIFLLLRIVGGLQLFTLDSDAFEPTLGKGSWLLVSKWVEPDYGEPVAFIAKNDPSGRFTDQTWVFRLVGKGGDSLLIKEGLLYRNGELVDDPEKLIFPYDIHKEDFLKHKEWLEDQGIEAGLPLVEMDKRVRLFLSKKQAELLKGKFPVAMNLNPLRYANPYILKVWNTNWSGNNFGPVQVPEGHIFVLGDNRPNSMDSRYIGFIAEDQIVGGALFH